jgi:hypothetical protein
MTDMYLLGLAVQNKGRLVTFDCRIVLQIGSRAEAEHPYVLG